MAKVFLSHASGDFALTHVVHRWLAEEGHEVFQHQHPYDGISIGEDWEQRLYERLRWADAVVCLVTSAYVTSLWCTAEVGAARSRGIRLLPLCPGPRLIHPLLTSTQHIDLDPDRAAARATLVETLYRVDATWPDDRSPFPGLRPFDTDQQRVFFGRAEEVGQLAGLLRSPAQRAEGAVLLVVGPSGCGKSSLVRAGLVPVMAGEPGWWTLPPILPGPDPVMALTRELAAASRQANLNWTVAHVRDQLDHGSLTSLADELLVAAAGGPRRRLLIVVDQFEELLTQTDPARRAQFAELLSLALPGPVQLVGTMRPEFLDQLLANPELAGVPTHPYPLRPLGPTALRAVIEKPATLAGIDWDGGLVDRMVNDTGSGEALPLLAFTLAQLADGITRGGRLSSARYDQLGGVQGALIRQADTALADALATSGRSSEEVISGLLRLVTVDEHGRPTRWRVNRNELSDQVVSELDAFIARRLLTTDIDNGTVLLGAAHEAFLSAWPPLAAAITASASALRARRAIEHAAIEWHNHDRPPARLWTGGQLAATVADTGARFCAGREPTLPEKRRRWLLWRHRVLVTDRVDLDQKARDFLDASIRRDRFQRRRASTVLSVLLVLALIGAGVAVVRQHEAQQQQRITTARLLMAQADSARDTDSRIAVRLGIAAQRINPGAETLSKLVETLTTTRYAGTLTDPGSVNGLAFAPDGRTLATVSADQKVILWDAGGSAGYRQLGQPLPGYINSIRSVAFAPGGHTLATGDDNGSVILWDVSDVTHPKRLGQPLAGHTGLVWSVAFAPDGRTLASGDENGLAILWDVNDLAHPRPLGQPLSPTINPPITSVRSVVFSPDSRILATGGDDKNVILWDIRDPIHPTRLGQPLTGTSWNASMAFTPDGRTLVTAGDNDTVLLWDVSDPIHARRLGGPLTGHTDSATIRASALTTSLALTSDGHIVAMTNQDDKIILWDVSDPTHARRLGRPLPRYGIPMTLAFVPKTHILSPPVGTTR